MKEISHCKTCRHWRPDTKNRYVNVGVCESPKVMFVSRYEDTENGKLAATERESDGRTDHVLDGDDAGVEDGSGYFARLLTCSEFGCIHYEPYPENGVSN